jgi:hypothetical protein
MPIQLDFILRRLAAMAEAQPDLRERQPWKAAHERDYEWLGALLAQHYAGDGTNVKVLAAGVLAAYDGMSVDEFEAQSDAFLRGTKHPTLGRGYLECAYAPMVELLRYLEANGVLQLHRLGRWSRLHAAHQSGGVWHPSGSSGRKQLAARLYERRAGRHDHSYGGARISRRPQKPIRIWSRTGRRPVLSCGNSNGDVPMLDFTQHAAKPSLRLLVLHDDAEREFDYTAGAERALERARADGWTVVSMKDDWATVFSF